MTRLGVGRRLEVARTALSFGAGFLVGRAAVGVSRTVLQRVAAR